jgi:hypothetical protein
MIACAVPDKIGETARPPGKRLYFIINEMKTTGCLKCRGRDTSRYAV